MVKHNTPLALPSIDWDESCDGICWTVSLNAVISSYCSISIWNVRRKWAVYAIQYAMPLRRVSAAGVPLTRWLREVDMAGGSSWRMSDDPADNWASNSWLSVCGLGSIGVSASELPSA
mmetsp:Transcript_29261/g.76821  ORF Transcript_29261/g.76821 Transcript_29261/m.76821 type:complete len:118 (+) Transcript_29261:102-455(+)